MERLIGTLSFMVHVQADSDQNYAPEEVVEEEERLRKEREGANKEALQVLLPRHQNTKLALCSALAICY